MKKSLATLAAIGAMMFSAPAFAGNASITYGDLNLSSPAGQKALDRRIERAARQVCGVNQHRTGTRLPNQNARKCAETVKQQAIRQIALANKNENLGG